RVFRGIIDDNRNATCLLAVQNGNRQVSEFPSRNRRVGHSSADHSMPDVTRVNAIDGDVGFARNQIQYFFGMEELAGRILKKERAEDDSVRRQTRYALQQFVDRESS